MKKKSISWKKIWDTNGVLGHTLFKTKMKTKMEAAIFLLYVRFIVFFFLGRFERNEEIQVHDWIMSLSLSLYTLQKAAENPGWIFFFQTVSAINLREVEKALKGISLWLQVSAHPPWEVCGLSWSVI